MLITDKFIVLNFPKTGSSFMQSAIIKLYQNRNKKNPFIYLLTKCRIKNKGYKIHFLPHPIIPDYKDQHGSYHQIPIHISDRKIVSIVRNPYSRFLSIYNYKWWMKNPHIEKKELDKYFPQFPNLSLDSFVDLQILVSNKLKQKHKISNELDIGPQTFEFINMFFQRPFDVFPNINIRYINEESYKHDMAPVKFLKQENLIEELIDFLQCNGFSKSECSFIQKMKRINESKIAGKSALTPKAIKFIEKYESLLFKILNNNGINYDLIS